MKQVKQEIHYWCHDTNNHLYRGQNVGVAILDTGGIAHPDYQGRIVAFEDFVSGKAGLYDDNSHGTHITGILGGDGTLSDGAYSGIAPGADLCILKVLDQKGSGEMEHLLMGMEWVLKHKRRYNIRIVNISIGALPKTETVKEDLLVEGVNLLWDAGIVVVTAAGNYGPQKGSITVPGVSRKVITVGASNDIYFKDHLGRERSHYSGRGPTRDCVCKPDVVAPGSYITSCNGNYLIASQNPYTIKSGTSMATPIVSGAAALLLCKYPDLTNKDVKLKLWECSDRIPLSQEQMGWGQVNVEKMLQK